jgi:hypothetical protein
VSQIVGSAHLTYLHVRDAAGAPANTDALPVLTVVDPAGATTTPTVTTTGTGEYRAAFIGSVPGDWRRRWTYTLAGNPLSGPELVVAFVAVSSAVGDLPSWTPTQEQVAARIPTRTRAVGVDDTYLGTFNDATTPTGAQVAAIIAQEVTAAGACAGEPIAAEAAGLCNLIATLRAAYAVEAAYPERDADVQVYEIFKTEAAALCKTAALVNIAHGGGSIDQGGAADGPSLAPAWSFPPAPAWKDSLSPTL